MAIGTLYNALHGAPRPMITDTLEALVEALNHLPAAELGKVLSGLSPELLGSIGAHERATPEVKSAVATEQQMREEKQARRKRHTPGGG